MTADPNDFTYPREAVQHYKHGAAIAMRDRAVRFLENVATVSAAKGRMIAASPSIPADLRGELAESDESDALRLRAMAQYIKGFDPDEIGRDEKEQGLWALTVLERYPLAEGTDAELLTLARRLTPLAYAVLHALEDGADPEPRRVRQIVSQKGEPLHHPVSGALLRASGGTATLATHALRALLGAPAPDAPKEGA